MSQVTAITEREQLEKAIAALDDQRATLGDVAVEAALAGLREKLKTLDQTMRGGSPAAVAGERRVVTILFCDVKGSTALAEKLDPEEWAGIMNRAFEYLTKPIYRHEGLVARLMGDGILAFFGAPLAHEDDPQRAILAGLEIIEGVRELGEQMKRERGLEFNVRVGINTGLAVVGEVGSDLRGEYTAMGDAVNLAARMEQTTRPGAVQITAHTYRLVSPYFEVEPLGGIEVKGKSVPVQAYRVIGPRSRIKPGSERQGRGSALVGREAELSILHSALERLSTGQGSIVGIVGEAGLGKSRLAAELKSQAMAQNLDLNWLEGSSLARTLTISYWPFQEILKQIAGIADNDSEAEAWTKLERQCEMLFGNQAVEIVPYLASLLSLNVRGEYESRVKYLDGEALGKQIFLAMRRFLQRLAQAKPVVLVMEDLHWVDESSANLLEHLLSLVESVPLLQITLTRPERGTAGARVLEIAAKQYPGQYTKVVLAPLSEAQSQDLIRQRLETLELPPRTIARIVERAEGNPFFLEQVVQMLIETGVVVRDQGLGRWRIAGPIETLDIPDTIQGTIMARIDPLDEELKQVLRVAAVIGRSFLYRVLQAVVGSGAHLDQDLARLHQAELISEKRTLPELEYVFKHGLVQEALYSSLLLQKRRELHARVGEAIESLLVDRLEEFYGLLAYHYARAEAWDKAQDYLLKAGDQAGRIAADAEALVDYQQALDAYTRAFGDRWEGVQRAALERKLGEAFFRRGEHTRAQESFQQALTYLGHPLPSQLWGQRAAMVRELALQASHHLFPRFSKPAGPAVSPSVEEYIKIYNALGWIDAFGNQERFLLVALRGLNFSEQHGYAYGAALGLPGIGMMFDFLSAYGMADDYLQRGLALAEQIGHPNAIGQAYYALALHEAIQGRWHKALEYGERSAQTYRRIGDLRGWGVAVETMGVVQVYVGDLRQAVASGQELVRFGQEGADSQVRCWGELLQGLVRRRMGHLEQARAHLQQAIDSAVTVPDYYVELFAHGELGQCLLRQGQLTQALDTLKAGERILSQRRLGGNAETALRNGLAEADLSAVEQATVPSARANWLNQAERDCRVARAQGKRFRPGLAEAMRLQGRCEWLRGNKGAAHKWWQASLMQAQTLEMPFELATTHLEIGQRLGERSHLEKARSLLAAYGADLVAIKEVGLELKPKP